MIGCFRLMTHQMWYADLKESIDGADRPIQRNAALSKRPAQFAYFPLEGRKGHLGQFHGEAAKIKMGLSQEVLGLNPQSACFALPLREYFL